MRFFLILLFSKMYFFNYKNFNKSNKIFKIQITTYHQIFFFGKVQQKLGKTQLKGGPPLPFTMVKKVERENKRPNVG